MKNLSRRELLHSFLVLAIGYLLRKVSDSDRQIEPTDQLTPAPICKKELTFLDVGMPLFRRGGLALICDEGKTHSTVITESTSTVLKIALPVYEISYDARVVLPPESLLDYTSDLEIKQLPEFWRTYMSRRFLYCSDAVEMDDISWRTDEDSDKESLQM